MPRKKAEPAIPSDFVPFKFSSVQQPIGQLNCKAVNTTFGKTEASQLVNRRPAPFVWDGERAEKRTKLAEQYAQQKQRKAVSNGPAANQTVPVAQAANTATDGDEPEGYGLTPDKIIIIHPGSRNLRIGRGSDALPLTVSNCIARRVSRPPGTANGHADEQEHESEKSKLLDEQILFLRSELRERLRMLKLRTQPNGIQLAKSYNEQTQPEMVPEHNDAGRMDWTDVEELKRPAYVVGDKALRIPDPKAQGYELRWPLVRARLDSSLYASPREMMADIEAIWTSTLEDELDIPARTFPEYSCILIVPDLCEYDYVREMCDMAFKSMGFKCLLIQQESLCVTFGAGLSSACVVDMGAQKVSVSCVEDGLVLSDTRITLAYGGDDVTRVFFDLLQRASFPIKDIDLARSYDWQLLDWLKENCCILNESDASLNLYNFHLRRPHVTGATPKYTIRLFDEVILAPMCLFWTPILDFESKRAKPRMSWQKPTDEVDELMETDCDATTQAMRNSTRYLHPVIAQPVLPSASLVLQALENEGPSSVLNASATPEPTPTPAPNGDMTPAAPSGATLAVPQTPRAQPTPESALPSSTSTSPPTMRKEESSAPLQPAISTISISKDMTRSSSPAMQASPQPQPVPPVDVDYPYIDVAFESSKTSVDGGIYESIMTSISEERLKRFLGNLILVGGTSLLHGMPFAVQSRLAGLVSLRSAALAQSIAITAPPREIDARIVAWKGAAVLARLDSPAIVEQWIRDTDYDIFGTRAFKDRCLFL
ncbi:uncharacterized protein L969DRAFT_90691 [Mixia osmundae IAM 14324]|uniref:Uncharacterized protein n=1 Tax=Mixia osmundae (strain CBS 9802 / IAM 14324 / JCM 22182 / KY 12970) TaxID=764103 RepID=G7E1Q4_MIXOS|nr:uncharacterized protein L969DRAFT_90691 [Mixia osmundae IAM 14324]KEI36714.1 hypothetical protein L969DRAFT_90691 [Mixia osmundae IAM 14324]GAA96764.1 hypothetical protein E5Q_03435 [Mixia osmundae IAM 14324]